MTIDSSSTKYSEMKFKDYISDHILEHIDIIIKTGYATEILRNTATAKPTTIRKQRGKKYGKKKQKYWTNTK
jgi:hypothetical protein